MVVASGMTWFGKTLSSCHLNEKALLKMSNKYKNYLLLEGIWVIIAIDYV